METAKKINVYNKISLGGYVCRGNRLYSRDEMRKMLEESGLKPEEIKMLYELNAEAALMEIPFLNKEEKEGFENLINKYIEIQASFDTPKESHLKAMDEEIAHGNNNPHLKRERDFVEMVCECVYIQKYYLKAFADAIGYTSTEQTAIPPIEVKEEASSDDTNLIKGVKGLAAFLGCGINTAQNIINSEILLKGKIQYRTGKGWRFRRDKLTDLLEKEPEIFKKVGSK